MTHVDIVKNEWLAGYQVVVGRVTVERGELHVDASEPNIESLVDRYWKEVGAESADEFVGELHTTLQGDYLFATTPHDEATCAYHAMVIALRADDPRARIGA